MIELRRVDILDISKYFVDFQKKSKSFEMPTEDAYAVGIYLRDLLIGYFILAGYDDGTLEIQQGYLKPMAQHKKLSYVAMGELQRQAKELGHTKIILKASRSSRAYGRFMTNLGYKPESIIYSRGI